MRTVVWFRANDLRIFDHAPLRDAAEGGEVIPLVVLDPDEFAPARAGVRLGETYPLPMVDHQWARERFLALASAHLRRG